MATQPTVRPWFRLASISRPAPPQAPEAQPPTTNPQQRPPPMRPTFTTSVRPPTTQPQEPAPPPPPPVSAPPPPPPPPVTAPPLPPPVSAPLSPLPSEATTAISTTVPSSPIGKTPVSPSSFPPSPPPKGSPSSTRISVTSSSVPPSPKPNILAPTVSSVPKSPVPKTLATYSSPKTNSPPPKQSAPTSPVPNLPPPKILAPISSSASSQQQNSLAPKFTVTNSLLQPTSSLPKAAPTSFSVQNSPTPKEHKSAITSTTRLPTPSPSTKFPKQPLAQSPPQSPNIRSYAPPPSPLVLPPSMLKPEGENGPKIPLEAEQKTMLVQKTIEKPKPSWFNGDTQSNAHKPSIFHGETYEKGSHNKKSSDTEEIGMKVITIAGENRGAFMELSHFHRKHGHFEGNPHSLMKKNRNESDSSSNDEGKSKMKDKHQNKMVTALPATNAYMNSNVQGINNSIVLNGSYTHHDPGVHLSLSRKPNGGHKMFQFKDNAKDHHN